MRTLRRSQHAHHSLPQESRLSWWLQARLPRAWPQHQLECVCACLSHVMLALVPLPTKGCRCGVGSRCVCARRVAVEGTVLCACDRFVHLYRTH
jgi:hypothetical protein